jgi:hypothetical protein
MVFSAMQKAFPSQSQIQSPVSVTKCHLSELYGHDSLKHINHLDHR